MITDAILTKQEAEETGFAECGKDAQQHPLVYDDGVLRFKADPLMRWLASQINLNNLAIFAQNADSREMRLSVRRFYRDIGYSICGYLDIFGDELKAERSAEISNRMRQQERNSRRRR